MLLGDALWHRRFGADRGIIGRGVAINGAPFTIVGVLPETFGGLTGRAELWIPPGMATVVTYADYLKTNQNFITVVGRLSPSAGLSEADAALRTIGAAIDRVEPTLEDRARIALRRRIVGRDHGGGAEGEKRNGHVPPEATTGGAWVCTGGAAGAAGVAALCAGTSGGGVGCGCVVWTRAWLIFTA